MSIWHLHSKHWSEANRRRVTHMVPEAANPVPPGGDTPADAVGEAIAALVDAVKAASGREVRVFTSGNLAPDVSPFVTVTIVPYVSPVDVAPVVPEGEARVDDAEDAQRRPCKGCPEK